MGDILGILNVAKPSPARRNVTRPERARSQDDTAQDDTWSESRGHKASQADAQD